MRLIISWLLLCITLPAWASQYYVVVGSFTREQAAQAHIQKLSSSLQPISIVTANRDAETLYRVVSGPFDNSFAAEQSQIDLIQAGFKEAWVYAASTDQGVSSTESTVASKPQAPSGAEHAQEKKLPLMVSQQREVTITTFAYETPVLQSEIAAILETKTHIPLTSAQILATRELINQLYVEYGYVNSGMVIPDQQIKEGVLNLDFISGEVSALDINSRLSQHYVQSRLNITEPFNLLALQQSLKALEQDPMVTRIDAEVTPGINPGEAALNLEVETVSRFEIFASAANDRSPSIGSENGEIGVTARNLSGWGETLRLSSSITEGLDAQSAHFHIPLSARGASASLSYALSDSSVIEEPFADIDVESQTESFSLKLTVPILARLTSHLDAHLTLEVRRNDTELLGQQFSFSEGAVNGESKVAPVRLGLSYLKQNLDNALAAQFSLSRGTSRFDATDAGGNVTARFTSYLAQVQYSRRISDRTHFTLRALTQYASDPLLSVEKFALGGLGSVRGYRQNQVVRDNARLASAELHYKFELPIDLSLVTFAEWGEGENHDDASLTGSEDLASFGLGLILNDWHGLSAELYVAHGFDDFNTTEYDLQDDGIHFRLGYRYAF